MSLTKLLVKMIDADGQKCQTSVHLAAGVDPTTLAALQTALDGISAAGITGLVASYVDGTAGVEASASGPYDSAEDSLVLEFSGAQAQPVVVSINAPDEDCFTADGETPDMAFLQAHIDSLAASIVDTAGGAVTFKRAYRAWNRRKKQ